MFLHFAAQKPRLPIAIGKVPGNRQVSQKTEPLAPVRFSSETTNRKLVEVRQEGPAAYITLNQLEKGNRLSREMISALDSAFRQAESNPQVKQIVFESNHPKNFCPGADIFGEIQKVNQLNSWLSEHASFLPKKLRQAIVTSVQLPSLRNYAIEGYHLVNRIERSPKVTIALVNGYAIGGGTELGLVCDYVVATPNAKFAIPEVKYGIFPDWGATERLPQRIGKTLSKFLILEGGLMADKGAEGPATLSGKEAAEIGLIDLLIPADNPAEHLNYLLNKGYLSEKIKRPVDKAALERLDRDARSYLRGSRFLEKYDRYQSASLEDLMQHELKGLYPPTLRLTNRRIENGPRVSRLAHEKDLATMFIYFAKAMGSKSSSNAPAK